MSTINNFYDAFVQKNAFGKITETEDLDTMFNEYLTEKMAGILVEDHEKSMNAEQMTSHIKKLFKMCDGEKTEGKFLKRLGSAAGVDDCKETDITSCAKKLCDMDDEKCDDVIHELEGLVDYKTGDKKDSGDSEDSEDSEESEESKKKVEEGAGVKVGSVIRTRNGRPMVVIGTKPGGEVVAARLHHGKPLYRTRMNLGPSDFEPTGDVLRVKSVKDLDSREQSVMKTRSDVFEPSQGVVGGFNF